MLCRVDLGAAGNDMRRRVAIGSETGDHRCFCLFPSSLAEHLADLDGECLASLSKTLLAVRVVCHCP